jgi:hypothetical protein
VDIHTNFLPFLKIFFSLELLLKQILIVHAYRVSHPEFSVKL